jgi:hypothetical protein
MKSVGGDLTLDCGPEEAETAQTDCSRESYGDDKDRATEEMKATYLHEVVLGKVAIIATGPYRSLYACVIPNLQRCYIQ